MKQDNYEVWRQEWKARFLSMDQKLLLQKLPFLIVEGKKLKLSYMGHMCQIDTETAGIDWDLPVSLHDELNIFTMLWYAKMGALQSNVWVPFAQLKDASVFHAAFHRNILLPLAKTFEYKGELLEDALRQLGGQKLDHGDVCYEIKVFECIPVRVLFWDGDDEFPAQANLLFDKSATDFIHVESIVTISSSILKHLARAAGISVDGATF